MASSRRRWLSLIVHPRDVAAGPSSAERSIKLALASGALDILQLRSTETDTAEDVIKCGKILAGYDLHHTKLVINHSSFHTAIATKANGWHLKERDLMARPQDELRTDINQAKHHKMLVGCSVHGVEAALRAADCGVDYIQAGTMFPTLSHPEKNAAHHLEGPQLLHSIRKALQDRPPRGGNDCLVVPVLIAVGGVNSQYHVKTVCNQGADGVAVIRGILAASDPHEAAVSYRQWVDEELLL